MRKTILTLMLVALAATSIATAGDYYDKHKKDAKQLGEPTEEMALVYMIRAAKMGAAIRTWGFYDEELIGVSRASGYSFALVPPGERLFWAKAENTSALRVNVEAGKTYYFKQKIVPGFGKARVRLEQVDEATAQKMLRKCGWNVPTDAARERAAEIVANRLDRAERDADEKDEKDGKSNG